MRAYKKSLILGTSIIALSIFTLPLSAHAHDPTGIGFGASHGNPIVGAINCYTTDENGAPVAIAPDYDNGDSGDIRCQDFTPPPANECAVQNQTVFSSSGSSSSSSGSSSSGSSSSGGGNYGGGDMGFDVNNDGIGDYSSYSEANAAVSAAGVGSVDSVNNCSDCGTPSDPSDSSNSSSSGGFCCGSSSTIGGFFGGLFGGSSSSSGGSGGSSGGNKVFCTFFFQHGQLSAEDYYSSNYYSLTKLPKSMLHGYHVWAIPYVKHMYKNPNGLAVKIMRPIVLHRAYELAYKMGVRDKPDYIGKLVRLVFEPTCYFIGLFAKEQDYSHLYTPKMQEILNTKYQKHMMKTQAQAVIASYNTFKKSLT